MRGLQFITSNPVADEMDQQALAADEARSREQQEFQSRYQHETQIGVDNALREGLSSIYPEPVGAPAGASASPGAVPGTASTGTSQPVSPTMPATPTDPNAALAARLAQTPGGGAAAFQLHQTSQQQQTAARKELNDRIYEAFKSNDPSALAYARTMAEQSGLQLPPELWSNAQARAKFVGMVEQMKSMGLEPHQMGQYLRGAQSAGGDDMSQLQGGLAAVPRETKVSGTITGNDGSVYFYNDQGGVTQAQAGGKPIHGYVGRGGRGGSGSVFQQKQQAWLASHPGDAQGALEFASGIKRMTDQDAWVMAVKMAQEDAKNDYTGEFNVDTRARELFGILQAVPAEAPPGGAPPPAGNDPLGIR